MQPQGEPGRMRLRSQHVQFIGQMPGILSQSTALQKPMVWPA